MHSTAFIMRTKIISEENQAQKESYIPSSAADQESA